MNREWIASLPKIELHCHLDGSVRPERMRQDLRRRGLPVPEDFQRQISVGEDCRSLSQYLSCFRLSVQWLQSEQALEQAVTDLLEDCAGENIRYIEIRFAPALHRFEGLGYDQVFQALERGRERGGAKTGVRCAFLVCALRNHDMEQNLEMLEAAKHWYPHLVCGADLAGDEDLHPVDYYADYFRRVSELGMPLTVHAGETGKAEHIAAALDFGAKRLGHGIAMWQDPALMDRVRAMGVGIEMCPTSNFQTRASTGWDRYPLRTFLDRGMLAFLNTDNPTVSATTLSREYLLAMEQGGVGREDVLRLLENACKAAFAPEEWKRGYLAELETFR